MADNTNNDSGDNKATNPPTPSTSALRKEAFLRAYSRNGNIGKSATAAGVTRNGADYWRRTDPEFAERVEGAKLDYVEKLEREADRRAIDGVAEPIFDKAGNQIGERRKYSDTLLIFRLKGLAPEKYAERRRVDQRVAVNVSPFQELSPAERAAELKRLQALAESVGPNMDVPAKSIQAGAEIYEDGPVRD